MKIGNFETENNVFLAPMAGVTDLPFRKICRRYGAGLVYSEMVSAKGLYYNDKKTADLMRIDDEERPCAIQIFGSDADIMAEVIPKVMAVKPDIIDINMGCPTPKIVNNGDGSALMKDPEHNALSTLKGPEIGNGDIKCAEDAKRMIDMTGCDAVMIGRGCEGNPFIFRQVNEYLKNGKVNFEPTPQDRLAQALEHIEMLVEEKGESRGIKEARKHIAWYIKGLAGSSRLKGEVFKISDIATMRICLTDYINQL